MAPARKREKLTRRQQWELAKRSIPEAWALARPYRHLLAAGMAMVLVNRVSSLVLPAAPKVLLDHVIPSRDMSLFALMVGAVVAATLVQGVTAFFLMQTISKAGQRLIRDLRVRIHDHVVRLPLGYFDSRRAGEVTSRVMNDVEGVRNLIGTGIVEMLHGVLTLALVVPILFWLNWQLTLTAVLLLSLFAIVVVKGFMLLRPIFEERQEVMGILNGRLTESFAGVRVVKAYTAEGAERGVFREHVDRLLGVIMRTINTLAGLSLATSALVGVVGATVLSVGGYQILSGSMKPGALISYILYLGFMIAPVAQMVSIAGSLSEAFAGLDRMRQVMDERAEDAGEATREPVVSVTGRVEFERVDFSYEAGKQVLHEVSFVAEPGTVSALVGPSGSGKSTITNLVAGFYGAGAGRVLVDGRDLATLRLSEYRRHLGVVLQDTFLFDGPVRDNVLYARPEATQDQLLHSARVSHALEFIEALPSGWDTVIGERGVKLSGGQRQRLAIARAVLADPRILILDEATSSLDSESEKLIQDGLSALMKGRTTFVIAHRLSTVRAADQILFVEGGRIIERGTHDALLALRGRYHELYSLQYGLGEGLFPSSSAERAETAGEGDEDRSARARAVGRMLLGN